MEGSNAWYHSRDERKQLFIFSGSFAAYDTWAVLHGLALAFLRLTHRCCAPYPGKNPSEYFRMWPYKKSPSPELISSIHLPPPAVLNGKREKKKSSCTVNSLFWKLNHLPSRCQKILYNPMNSYSFSLASPKKS